jgi:hypothetical protein
MIVRTDIELNIARAAPGKHLVSRRDTGESMMIQYDMNAFVFEHAKTFLEVFDATARLDYGKNKNVYRGIELNYARKTRWNGRQEAQRSNTRGGFERC